MDIEIICALVFILIIIIVICNLTMDDYFQVNNPNNKETHF